jgi:hypothetical protein
MTQDDISDLRSLIKRAETCAVDLINSTLAKQDADRQLENFLLRMRQDAIKSMKTPPIAPDISGTTMG